MLVCTPLLLSLGCAALVGRATARLADDLEAALLDQDDPATVRDGAPAFLLMLDGLIEGDPDDPALLLSGASLYGSYAGAFVEDPVRARRLTARALDYARRAACARERALGEALDAPYEPLAAAVAEVGPDGLDVLYGLGVAWAGFVQAHSSDWAAVADVPKIEAVMRRVLALDPEYEGGAVHLYLGVLSTLRPAALGGRPEEGRRHFEEAIRLSGGRDLMAKVLFARHYARLVFDRELHDRLLGEVLAADPVEPGLTLSNVLAQEQARVLLDGSDDYF
jgi:hypothetical protein